MVTNSYKGQGERWYYEHYRRGLIQRHICANGRLLQEVLLVEQDASKDVPNEKFHRGRRYSKERSGSNGATIDYSAYPVIVNDESIDDVKIGRDSRLVVGGGDNPLLDGGLAMAVFSLETLQDVSDHSFSYAKKLLDYVLSSETVTPTDERQGFFRRRRQWWDPLKVISKDELCGLFVGLHFYHKAALKVGDVGEVLRATQLLGRLGSYLKEKEYGPASAWVYQFPFTRVFKFTLGTSYLSGSTFPFHDDGISGVIEFLGALLTLDLDLSLDPKDLYRIVVSATDDIYRGATVADAIAEIFGGNVDANFYNFAMHFHTLLMIHDNDVSADVRDMLWGAFSEMFSYLCVESVGAGPGSGDGRLNVYFAVVMEAFAQGNGKLAQVEGTTGPMRAPLATPSLHWGHDLPLCDLPKYLGADGTVVIPGSKPFADKGWGSHFTWEKRDSSGHRLDWDWGKTLREIGPRDRAGLLMDSLCQGDFYFADPQNGFRVEAAGLDLLFPRILASYWGQMPPPDVLEDEPFEVLPVDGPPGSALYLANSHTKEVHDYYFVGGQCQEKTIKDSHRKWYGTLSAARKGGYDNCANCIGGSKR